MDFYIVSLSWLLFLVIFPWLLSCRLATRTEKWHTQSWESPLKLEAYLYARHTQSKTLNGQFSGKKLFQTVVSRSLVPLSINSFGIKPFPESLDKSPLSLPPPSSKIAWLFPLPCFLFNQGVIFNHVVYTTLKFWQNTRVWVDNWDGNSLPQPLPFLKLLLLKRKNKLPKL